MGLTRRPWTTVVEGTIRRPCSPVVLFSNGGPGEAVHDPDGRATVQKRRFRETSFAGETKGKNVGLSDRLR